MMKQGKSSRLTIKDIARMSGVSKSTVSRIINQDQRVSDKTRQHVQSIIQQHQFVPSKSAREMRGYRDKVIGVIVTRLDSSAENCAVRAMLAIFQAKGYQVLLAESQFNVKKVEKQLALFQAREVSGVVVFAFDGITPDVFLSWQDRIVIVARNYPDFTCINYDDIGAMQAVLQRLYQQQHQRIAYIGVNVADQTTGSARYLAYQQFCQQHQLMQNAQLGSLSYESGYQLTEQVLLQKPSAILCATDTLALGVNQYLQKHQQTQVTVWGLGNHSLLHFLYPDTYSVDLGYHQGGEAAAIRLLAKMAGLPNVASYLVPFSLPSH